MSTKYVDRDGYEWDKNCGRCTSRTNRGEGSSTYCDAHGQFLAAGLNSDCNNEPFASYYKAFPNSCPHFYPVGL